MDHVLGLQRVDPDDARARVQRERERPAPGSGQFTNLDLESGT